jgi:hypothetical protein
MALHKLMKNTPLHHLMEYHAADTDGTSTLLSHLSDQNVFIVFVTFNG